MITRNEIAFRVAQKANYGYLERLIITRGSARLMCRWTPTRHSRGGRWCRYGVCV